MRSLIAALLLALLGGCGGEAVAPSNVTHRPLSPNSGRIVQRLEGELTTMNYILQTTAVDARTVKVTFKEPRAAQLNAFNIGVMPEHVYAKGSFAKITRVVGTGPYVVDVMQPGRTLRIKRRDDYWREKPPIESILFRTIADDAVAWRAVKRGDVDVSHVDNDVWFREKDDPAVSEKLDFHSVYILQY